MDAKESLVHVLVVVSGTDTWLHKSITVQYSTTQNKQTNKIQSAKTVIHEMVSSTHDPPTKITIVASK